MRVTHPFHPHSGRRLSCVAERYNRYGKRILLEADGRVYSVLKEWTDLVTPDPEVVLGEGRSMARLRDLVDLASLVAGLMERRFSGGPSDV